MSLRPHLWNVIEAARGDEAALRELLQRATPEQVILLRRRFDEAAAALRELPAFAARAGAGAGVVAAWADWIVTRGRKAWSDARRDPAGAAAPPADRPDFRGAFERVYRERFGGELPHEEPDPAADPSLRYDPAWDDELWKLIDVVNAGVPMAQATSGYTRSELALLEAAARAIVERLEQELARRTGGERANPTWIGIGDWLLGKGAQAVEHYLAHPEELPGEVSLDEPMFAGQLDTAYEERYGTTIPMLPIP